MSQVNAIFRQAVQRLACDPIDYDTLADVEETATANAADDLRKEG